MAWAEEQYHRFLLDSPEAEVARRYLAERGIAAESIEKFHIGFSPNDRDWILQRAGGDPKRAKILETVGILARPQGGGGYYDRFRGRLLFSIRDAQGRPVAFGGRVLPESATTSPAKYVNSPETPLFSKSNLLYALDVARDAIRRSGTALVMEGYTDVIVAHQHGFQNAVAALGTAVGEQHVKILKRFADRIILVLDGDEAGRKRANEVLELFVAQEADLRILTLPDGADPCDYLQHHEPEEFQDLLDNQAIDALRHAFRVATRGLDLEGGGVAPEGALDLDRDIHEASQALDHLLSIVARAPRLGPREEKIVQQLAGRFRLDEMTVRRRLKDLQRRAHRGTSARTAPAGTSGGEPASDIPPGDPGQAESPGHAPGAIDRLHREMLELLIGHPECLPEMRADIGPEEFLPGPCRRIYQTACRLTDDGVLPDFSRLMLEFDDEAVKNLLVELDEGYQAKGDRELDPHALLQKLIESFHRQEAERQRPRQLGALRQKGLDASQETELLNRIIRQERNRQGISEPTDE
jgi:DNA primase